jgi:hypothetical protein
MLGDIEPPADGQSTINSGVIGDHFRWKNKVLIFKIDAAFSQADKDVIHAAMNAIAAKTCITFKAHANEADFVFIRKGTLTSGCYSNVGKTGGQQILNLQPAAPGKGHCIWKGTIAHELIHAIGFYHEQSRPNRDDYVTIVWSNIPAAQQHNFNKYTTGQVNAFNVPYDYRSIMHYKAHDFASNPAQPTIIPKTAGAVLGGEELTNNDALKINRMYGCAA